MNMNTMQTCSDGLDDGEGITEELDQPAEDCMLVDFDEDFPFEDEPEDEDAKKQFIHDLLHKMSKNGNMIFGSVIPECMLFMLLK